MSDQPGLRSRLTIGPLGPLQNEVGLEDPVLRGVGRFVIDPHVVLEEAIEFLALCLHEGEAVGHAHGLLPELFLPGLGLWSRGRCASIGLVSVAGGVEVLGRQSPVGHGDLEDGGAGPLLAQIILAFSCPAVMSDLSRSSGSAILREILSR